MSPTPQQSLQSSIEAMQLQTEVEDQESGSCERLTVTQEEESIRKAQEVVNEVNQKWTAVYLTIAKRMLKHLNDSEALKVSTRELKEVLSSNEPSVNIVRIARQATSEKSKKVCSRFSQRTRSKRDPCRQYGEMGRASENG